MTSVGTVAAGAAPAASMSHGVALRAALGGLLVGWFAAKTLTIGDDLWVERAQIGAQQSNEARTPGLGAAPAAPPSAASPKVAPPQPAAPTPLVALTDDELDFPYGRCWPGSNETCRRPFLWREMSDAELSAVYSEQEKRNVAENACPEALKGQNRGQCCLGATSNGGGLTYSASVGCNLDKGLKGRASPGPLHSQRYWSRFELVFEVAGGPVQALFELPDVLAALPDGSRVAILGDSVMHQVFDGLMCAASRDARVKITALRQYPRVLTWWIFGAGERVEADIELAAEPGAPPRRYSVVHHREYRWAPDGLTIMEMCKNVDVLLFNFGSHWNVQSEFRDDLPLLAQWVDEHCVAHGVQVVFRGSGTQHFITPNGLYNTNTEAFLGVLRRDGMNESEIEALQQQPNWSDTFTAGCGPLSQHWDKPESNYDWRNRAVVRAFAQRGFGVAMTPWGKNTTGCAETGRKTLFYVPFGEVTMDRHDMHVKECTHYCSSPTMWNPIADGLFLAVRQRDARLCGEPVLRHALGARRRDGQLRPGNPNVPNLERQNGSGFQILGLVGKDPMSNRERTYKSSPARRDMTGPEDNHTRYLRWRAAATGDYRDLQS